MSRRRRRGGSHCNDCGAVIVFFRSATNGKARPFDPRPADRTGPVQDIAYPVENGAHWWHPRDLIEDLMVRREVTQAEAAVEVDDMPWYLPHRCRTHHPDLQEEQLHTHDDHQAGERPSTAPGSHESGPQAVRRALAGTGGGR